MGGNIGFASDPPAEAVTELRLRRLSVMNWCRSVWQQTDSSLILETKELFIVIDTVKNVKGKSEFMFYVIWYSRLKSVLSL